MVNTLQTQKIENNTITTIQYPSLIKYMGSKSKIMDFVIDGINYTYKDGSICDLFSGSASLAGAIGQQITVHSNDIQSYSSVLANTYNRSYKNGEVPTSEVVYSQAQKIYKKNARELGLSVTYDKNMSLDDFNEIEAIQKSLINVEFEREWHLFLKNYSGTWWSSDQCLWIDSFREVCENYKNTPIYFPLLSSLMFAMAYASQGTGHYAQYRDAKTQSSLTDILIYRKRSISDYFIRKYEELLKYLPSKPPRLNHIATNLDYKDCLDSFEGGLVYADPPYCFVHYSRFYHALETVVLYDYPNLQIKGGKLVKGRYRENRHQSPFCIKTKVENAFKDLFNGVKKSNSSLVLSYSNTGMISLDKLNSLVKDIFKHKKIDIFTTNHNHMTLGRLKDRHREVKECLVIVKN